MRRLGTTTDVLLLLTVCMWAFNVVVTRYVLKHGFLPLSYASIRYAGATLLTVLVALALERTLAVHGRQATLLVGVAALLLYVNQLCFVYALDLTTATTVSLILGTTPIFTAALSSFIGLERITPRFWLAAVTSFAGVALVAVGSGGELSADLGGELLALALAATWAAYSVCLVPLMRDYSPYRLSALILLLTTAALLLTSIGVLGDQDYGAITGLDWAAFVYAVIGPLVLTNVLWYTAVRRVGPSRATLFGNLQPFIAVLFAVVILSETLDAIQIVGGVLIGIGIVIGRTRRRSAVAVPAE
jgi:drug/metabolite transporter (DMT)-like permease